MRLLFLTVLHVACSYAPRHRLIPSSRQRSPSFSTNEPAEPVDDAVEEDADAAILRELEQEVTRLDAARQECERTITRLFAELDAAQIERAKTMQAYERAYNRYQQTKGIQEQLQASRRKAEARQQSLDGVDVVAAAAALKSRPQSAPIAGSYVPDGLSAEEWAELQARERAPREDLGSWGSKVGGESEPQRGDLMSQPTIWTDPAKFFREDQKLKYEAAQSDASRPNIYASGETSFEQWQSKLINDMQKKPEPEAPVAEDPEAAEAKNQEIVQALGAVAAAGAGALVVAGVVEAEAALATGTAAAAVLGTVVSSAVAAKQAADGDEGENKE